MNKSRLAFVLDIAFRYLIIFFVAFAWLRFYIYNGVVCALIAFAISVAINTTISAVTNHRNSLKKIMRKSNPRLMSAHSNLPVWKLGFERNFLPRYFLTQ